jgi:hypothetical protein
LILIINIGDLSILDLIELTISENVAVASGKILHIIGVILVVNGGIKNPIKLARELLVN